MSQQTNDLAAKPAITFKTAVMFRRAMTEGGLYAQMMPGVFETAEALADGMRTHKAISPDAHVYIPVDVALNDKREPVSVRPIESHLLAALKALLPLAEASHDYAVEGFQWTVEAVGNARAAINAAEGRS